MDEPIYRLLGLCMKAGLLLSGTDQLKASVKGKQGSLLIIAEDGSERTKDEYIHIASAVKLPWRVFGKKEQLGRAIGKGVRTVVLIMDDGFGTSLTDKIDSQK